MAMNIPGLDKDPIEAISPMGAGQIPGGNEIQAPPAQDPVMEALTTLGKFAISQREKGNPALVDWVQQGVKIMQGMGQEGGTPQAPGMAPGMEPGMAPAPQKPAEQKIPVI